MKSQPNNMHISPEKTPFEIRTKSSPMRPKLASSRACHPTAAGGQPPMISANANPGKGRK